MTMKTSSILNTGIKPIVLVLLLSLVTGIAYGQNPNSGKKRKDIEKRAGFVVTTDRKDIVVDKDLLDAYVRIMRYQTAWQDIYNEMNNNPTALDDYLTIAINNVETGDMKKLANYLKAIKQPSADVLSVNRHIVCGRGGEAGDCELGYEVNWAKEGAQYGLKFNTPNTGNVDEYITYDITVEYKGESVTHGGVILHYRNKNAGFLIYDGIIPHIDDLVLDRMPLLVEPRPNNGNQSKVKKLPAAKVWGWGAATTDDDVQPPIGWLPGDYEELPGYDWDGGGMLLMAAATCIDNRQPESFDCDSQIIQFMKNAWSASGNGSGNEWCFSVNGTPQNFSTSSVTTSNSKVECSVAITPGGTWGIIHVHPNSHNEKPSSYDIDLAIEKNIKIVTISSRGSYIYDPATGVTSQITSGLEWRNPCN